MVAAPFSSPLASYPSRKSGKCSARSAAQLRIPSGKCDNGPKPRFSPVFTKNSAPWPQLHKALKKGSWPDLGPRSANHEDQRSFERQSAKPAFEQGGGRRSARKRCALVGEKPTMVSAGGRPGMNQADRQERRSQGGNSNQMLAGIIRRETRPVIPTDREPIGDMGMNSGV